MLTAVIQCNSVHVQGVCFGVIDFFRRVAVEIAVKVDTRILHMSLVSFDASI